MRWFRSNIRFGSRLALLSLALQALLTFGHVHLDGVRIGRTPNAISADHAAAVAPKAPERTKRSQGLADSDCPICALIQLAATAAPSVAPALPTPTLIGGLRLEACEDSQRVFASYLAFQARGPPVV